MSHIAFTYMSHVTYIHMSHVTYAHDSTVLLDCERIISHLSESCHIIQYGGVVGAVVVLRCVFRGGTGCMEGVVVCVEVQVLDYGIRSLCACHITYECVMTRCHVTYE